jgi:hypothetical protein
MIQIRFDGIGGSGEFFLGTQTKETKWILKTKIRLSIEYEHCRFYFVPNSHFCVSTRNVSRFCIRKFKNQTEKSKDSKVFLNILIQILDTSLCSKDTNMGIGNKIESAVLILYPQAYFVKTIQMYSVFYPVSISFPRNND